MAGKLIQDKVDLCSCCIEIWDHRLGIRRGELVRNRLLRLTELLFSATIINHRDNRGGDITVGWQDINLVG